MNTNATDEQDVLLALAWSLPFGKTTFRAYPESVFIDGTHKTNKERRPLITLGVKDAEGKVIVVFRAFVPNERAWLSNGFLRQLCPPYWATRLVNVFSKSLRMAIHKKQASWI